MKRVFFAIALPDEFKEQYQAFLDQLPPGVVPDWEEAQKLHITLAFIGEATQDQEDELIALAQEVAKDTPPFKLTLHTEISQFPPTGTPQVYWWRVKDVSGALEEFYQKLTAQLKQREFQVRDYQFTPHVTIMRKPKQDKREVATLLIDVPSYYEFPVSGITLFASTLTEKGSSYTILHHENFRH